MQLLQINEESLACTSSKFVPATISSHLERKKRKKAVLSTQKHRHWVGLPYQWLELFAFAICLDDLGTQMEVIENDTFFLVLEVDWKKGEWSIGNTETSHHIAIFVKLNSMKCSLSFLLVSLKFSFLLHKVC